MFECCISQLAERDYFGLLFDSDLDAYVARQRLLNVWGDEYEVLAMAELYNKRVIIYEHGIVGFVSPWND